MSTVSIVSSLPEEPWRRFVEENPGGNIFHTPEMFQVFSRAKGYKPILWAALDNRSRVLALFLPVQVSLFNGLLRLVTTRFIAYGSVLCTPSAEGQAALRILLQTYNRKMKRRALFTELRNLSDLKEIQPVLCDHAFSYEDHLNYLIPINRPPEEILQRMGPRTRKQIRHGLRQGHVMIEEVSCRDGVGSFFQLLQKTYSAAKVPLADQSLFAALFEVLYPRGMIKFLLARVGDNYASGSVELLFKKRIYGWYAGTDRAYTKYVPNELLMWHILRWGAENGYGVYDFGGAGKPDGDYGVRNFKAKFGGELVCFGRNICVHSPFRLTFSKMGYAVFRRFL